MKKIYQLFALAIITVAFAACHPLDETYDKIGPVPQPAIAAQSLTITLVAADYALLPGTNYAKTTLSFKTKDDAATSIPAILASKYAGYPNKSTALVTYAFSPASIAVADTVFNDVAYTLTDADYLLLTKYGDLSDSQILTFLTLKYPAPLPNQLALLTYNYYFNGVAAIATQSFLYLNSAWKKIYTISPAQYTSIGKGGTYNDFSSSDAPNLPGYFNALLKADPAVSATAKFGDIQYVSFKYYSGGNFQRVLPLTFDGTNWTTGSTPATLSFAVTNGAWVADNTVYYSLVAADYTYIGTQTTAGSADARGNVASYGNFNITGTGTTSWSDADLQAGLIALLQHLYPGAVANQKFVITYKAYNGATITAIKTLQFDGTTFKQI